MINIKVAALFLGISDVHMEYLISKQVFPIANRNNTIYIQKIAFNEYRLKQSERLKLFNSLLEPDCSSGNANNSTQPIPNLS